MRTTRPRVAIHTGTNMASTTVACKNKTCLGRMPWAINCLLQASSTDQQNMARTTSITPRVLPDSTCQRMRKRETINGKNGRGRH
ncbi:MAG: hypothetical protein EBR58_09675 [Betaproteobacteria bacterium]|nr:hypothetical protein [Betaproteobacteria bacterium]